MQNNMEEKIKGVCASTTLDENSDDVCLELQRVTVSGNGVV